MTVWDIALRSVIFLIVLFAAAKLLGKKHISQLSFFEYVSGIVLGDIAGEVILGEDQYIMHGIVGIFIFTAVTYLADFLSLKSRRFREIIEGKCTVFIENGKILEDHLKKERYSVEDLAALLREKDVFNIADVEFAVLEPKGKLSVLLKKEKQPLTPKDLKIKTPNEKEPQAVIMDGQVIYEALGKTGKTLEWVNKELSKQGVSLNNVFYAQIDSYGEMTIDLYNDKTKTSSPNARPLLLAEIKKTQADLESFSLQTSNKAAKNMYAKNAEKMTSIQKRLEPFLKG
ncbi:DUF421 domain-containing protein [Peribacillus kribbensis]|uniref:DUF421 domain-containing protein n=1 Tax=Peribacillus kribbensis TaxID=356658 RepID=UPI0003FDA985|nr:DUF421 domain-containing protein [Peribacillus kribbensis]